MVVRLTRLVNFTLQLPVATTGQGMGFKSMATYPHTSGKVYTPIQKGATSSVEPSLTQLEVGASNVIWLPQGLLEPR